LNRREHVLAKLINIGFGNTVNSDKIVAVVNPDAAPIKRLIQNAKEQGKIIDATQGRRTKAVIVTSEGLVILSALQTDTISKRFNVNISSDERGEGYE